MAFTSAVLADVGQLDLGEVLGSKIHNVQSFDKFDDALLVGRFVVLNTTTSTLRAFSANPTMPVIGVTKRKVTNQTSTGNNQQYNTTGINVDSVAEVVNFGFVVVEVPTGPTLVRSNQVYVDANGLATNVATANVIIPNCKFVERVSATSWIVCMGSIV